MGKFKDFIKRNGKKIITGATIALTIAGYYIVYQYASGMNDELNVHNEKIDILNHAASEGLFKDAISTTERKIFWREDKIKYLMNKNDEDNIAKRGQYINEVHDLKCRLESYKKTQALYEIE